MEYLFTTENAAALLTLTILEIVLGIDNIVFISILSGKLPKEQQGKARFWGLMLAMFARIALLLAIGWVMGLSATWFTLPFLPVAAEGEDVFMDAAISGRDLILILGGGFLIYKATHEIHDKIEGSKETISQPKATKFSSVMVQIVAIDLVFSLDSVITAVGMVQAKEGVPGWVPISIMITAIMISIGVMIAFAGPISRFVEAHPTTKMLALAFLFMIGMVLVADGFGQHIPKGYIYTAMAFSIGVEMLNLRLAAHRSGKVPQAE
ncbi:MAG: TerC family protein [Phycisphaerales bacterium]